MANGRDELQEKEIAAKRLKNRASFVSTNWAIWRFGRRYQLKAESFWLMKVLLLFLENPERGLPLLALCPVIMAGFRFLSRRRRRMEVRADVFGSSVYEDKSIYARALAKLYQANEMPAIMPRKRMPYPHLYDRMVVAGVTPDFPRPGRPARWGSWLGVLIVAVNMASFLSIQSFVLDLFL